MYIGEAPAKLQAATYPETQKEGGIANQGHSFTAGLASFYFWHLQGTRSINFGNPSTCFDTNQTQKHAVPHYIHPPLVYASRLGSSAKLH